MVSPRCPHLAALLPAAGSGVRLGLGPKAYVQLGGVTLLEHAVTALVDLVDEVIVAVPAGTEATARELLGGTATVVVGGSSRQATVRALLAATTADVVLVHDAARPFVPAAVVERVVAAVARVGAATAALPVADTIVSVADGAVVPRDALRAVQTPQGFRRELLARAHDAAMTAGAEATDDAALVRLLGAPVALVEGSPLLHKITTEADLALGEALLALWRARRGVPG